MKKVKGVVIGGTGHNAWDGTISGMYGVLDGACYKNFTWNGDLNSLYDALDCDIVDIHEYNVGGVQMTFVIDDEGLLKNSFVSAVNGNREPMLVGKLFVCNTTMSEDGSELSSITDEQYTALVKNLLPAMFEENGETTFRMIVGNVEYC